MNDVHPGQEDMSLLQSAFQTFDHAAAALQESYRTLTVRLERMDLELAASNEALRLNLKEKEEMRSHLASILESLTTGVIVSDQRGIVVRCNQAAERLLGLDRQPLLGQALEALLVHAQLDGTAYPLMTPGGIPVSLTRAPLLDAGGAPSGTILLLHDISAVRRLEEQLQRRDRLASMGEMVGRIAHEIRNPLGSVELFASLLRKDLRDDPQELQYAEHISLAVKAMDRLLGNLLTYTRPKRPSADWCAVEPLVRETLTLASHGIAGSGIHVECALDSMVPAIWCDPAQIKQVMLNLVLNAVQAMGQGGTLSIRVAQGIDRATGAGAASIAITDTGFGIDATHLARVFDPFFTTREDGTGLGLAIAHALVEGHGGRIDIESQVGQGSTFTIVLPGSTQPHHVSQGRVREELVPVGAGLSDTELGYSPRAATPRVQTGV
jgi:signal transduction histidine kinase